MDTDKAVELLRSFYAMRISEAKVREPRGGTGDPAGVSSRNLRAGNDRYARLDSPLAAFTAAAAAFIMMAGFGLACQRWEARPISPDTLTLLSEVNLGAVGIDRAIKAIRETAPRTGLKGERL